MEDWSKGPDDSRWQSWAGTQREELSVDEAAAQRWTQGPALQS